MFDNLLLLSKGRIVFQGPAAKAVPYFASIGHPCPIVRASWSVPGLIA